MPLQFASGVLERSNFSTVACDLLRYRYAVPAVLVSVVATLQGFYGSNINLWVTRLEDVGSELDAMNNSSNRIANRKCSIEP